MSTQTTAASIPLSVPQLGGNEWTYLKEALDTGWVSSVGPFVDRFEREVAGYVGASHAVAVINGTAGLHIALHVAGVRPDDEVLVSTLTFIAPVNAIRYCQAHPVFIDADAETWQMDVRKAGRFLREDCEIKDGMCRNRKTGRRVRAILPVHILGLACAMDEVMGLARRYHLQVVEDAAEAIGVRYRGRHVGTWGDLGVLSFNGNKLITCGGGGMVVTNDRECAKYAKYLTTQAKDDEREYVHNEVGYNYRLTNLQAAVGVAQLEQVEPFLERKRAIARAYEEAFRGVEGLVTMPVPPHTEPTYWLYTVLLKDGVTLEQRTAFLEKLQADGIGARPLWHPIHRLPPYRQEQATAIDVADRLYARAISLPSSVGLDDADQRRCIEAVLRHIGSV